METVYIYSNSLNGVIHVPSNYLFLYVFKGASQLLTGPQSCLANTC